MSKYPRNEIQELCQEAERIKKKMDSIMDPIYESVKNGKPGSSQIVPNEYYEFDEQYGEIWKKVLNLNSGDENVVSIQKVIIFYEDLIKSLKDKIKKIEFLESSGVSIICKVKTNIQDVINQVQEIIDSYKKRMVCLSNKV